MHRPLRSPRRPNPPRHPFQCRSFLTSGAKKNGATRVALPESLQRTDVAGAQASLFSLQSLQIKYSPTGSAQVCKSSMHEVGTTPRPAAATSTLEYNSTSQIGASWTLEFSRRTLTARADFSSVRIIYVKAIPQSGTCSPGVSMTALQTILGATSISTSSSSQMTRPTVARSS